MKVVGWVLGAVFVLGLLVAGCVAVVNDEDSRGRAQWASHDYGYECDPYYEPCGGGQNYEDQWSNEDRNRNRGRNRGAFSPGPFDDSPIDMRNACISLDCSGRERSEDRPPEREPMR